jgi:uncharacterized protein (TIGR02145 family)
MRILITTTFLFNFMLSFCQLASWNNGGFKEMDKKSVNNLTMWTEGDGWMNYEEISRNQNSAGDVEVILNDLNGRAGMQVRLTKDASYWKYQKDPNWMLMSNGTWVVAPVLVSTSKNAKTKEKNKKKSSNSTTSNNTQAKNFNSVKIGTQTWMVENLNVVTFRNGDPIPEAKSDEEWQNAANEGKPAWCYYDNDIKNLKIYGRMYNYYAITDKRGICPEGWHIPSNKEWQILIDNVGGQEIAGKKLKSKSGWANVENEPWNEKPNKKISGNGTDNFGFCGLPGSFRCEFGAFGFYGLGEGEAWAPSVSLTYTSLWWSTTITNEYIQVFSLGTGEAAETESRSYYKGEGLYIRCIKD